VKYNRIDAAMAMPMAQQKPEAYFRSINQLL